MRSILRATTMLSASTGVTVAMGLASAKIWAVLVGTRGVGYMGLLMSLLGLITLVAGLGVNAGLVRFGARAIADGNEHEFAALRCAAWVITAATGCIALPILILFRVTISEIALGGSNYADIVPVLGLALLFALVSGVQLGILNAYHRVGALAKFGVLASVLGTLAELPFIWVWKASGVPFAILATAVVTCAISSIVLRLELGKPTRTADLRSIREQATRLLHFGAPYTASAIVGSGVLLVMPILVLHVAGQGSVGPYRAAATIGVTYLGFLLAAMAQDYFPRVSAAGNKPGELLHLINQQQRLVMLLAMPVILGALTLAPIVVPLLYTQRFAPAASVLEWQLIGDVFRLSSWTLSFVVLARFGSKAYFGVELAGGGAILLSSWLAMSRFGLVGAGMGYLAGYVVYYAVVWAALGTKIRLRLTRSNVYLLAAAVAAVAVVRLLSLAGDEGARLAVGLVLALVFGLYSLRAILQEGWDRSRPMRLRTIVSEAGA